MNEPTQNTTRWWEVELQQWINTQHGTAGWEQKLENLIEHIVDKAYVAGYRAANGYAGTAAGILWANREEELSSAVQKEREAIEIELDKIYHDLAALQKRFTPGQEEYDRYKNKADGIRDAISVVLTRMYKDLPKQNPK